MYDVDYHFPQFEGDINTITLTNVHTGRQVTFYGTTLPCGTESRYAPLRNMIAAGGSRMSVYVERNCMGGLLKSLCFSSRAGFTCSAWLTE